MFAYCMNNPVSFGDADGNWPKLSTILFEVAIAAVAVVASCGAAAPALAIAGGGILGGVSAGATYIATGAMIVAGVSCASAIASSGIEKNVEKKLQRNQSVYVLKDVNKQVQYVGRTNDVDRRKKEHERNPYRKDLELVVLQSNLNYYEARAVEQASMLYYHTLNTANKMNNQVNGISPINRKLKIYQAAAFGLLGYTWNQVSNEILCWHEG